MDQLRDNESSGTDPQQTAAVLLFFDAVIFCVAAHVDVVADVAVLSLCCARLCSCIVAVVAVLLLQ